MGKFEDLVVGIGVSVFGIVDLMEGIVIFIGVFSFMGIFDLVSYICLVSGCLVFIGNDVNCVILVELW